MVWTVGIGGGHRRSSGKDGIEQRLVEIEWRGNSIEIGLEAADFGGGQVRRADMMAGGRPGSISSRGDAGLDANRVSTAPG